jgi:hypothetical protein
LSRSWDRTAEGGEEEERRKAVRSPVAESIPLLLLLHQLNYYSYK